MELADLGLTQEEIADRVVERVSEQLLTGIVGTNEYGEEVEDDTRFAKALRERIKTRIDETVAALAERHVLAHIPERIETICIQATNSWGEAKGEPVTFIEYLVKRAEEYLTEKVDFEGKSKDASRGYSWSGTQTRLTHLVHQHLHYSIERAMKAALEEANSHIAGGITDAVKIKLDELLKGIKATVQVKA